MQYNNKNSQTIDRYPAVAGQFYPDNETELYDSLKRMFSDAHKNELKDDVMAIVVPHAGYVFSGEIAASAFNQLCFDKQYENIFLIGSSHRTYFEGASVYDKGDYIMPFGKVKVNRQIASELIEKYTFFSFRNDAHTTEHCLEVQLPFLHYKMSQNVKIIPIIIATQSIPKVKEIADALKPYFNAKNLFIISTDLSHYPEYEDAKRVDAKTINAVLSNNPDHFLDVLQENEKAGIQNLATSMCGWTSVLTLLNLTQNIENISYHLIDYKNSGDSPFGDHDRVVGYSAICVTQSKSEHSEINFELTKEEKSTLLKIARLTINQYTKTNQLPDLEVFDLTSNIEKPLGAFVTLRKKGNLRGCIGRFNPDEPLYKVVQEMAVSSSTRDYRFNPVTEEELPDIEIEISVLTPMKKINSIDEIILGKHGIYVVKNGRSGTFLPGVANETNWTKEEFLGHCARDKAGIGWDGWKDADIYIYESLAFHE